MDEKLVNDLLDSIRHLNYVVIRNWKELPKIDAEHPDLDILVSDRDYQEIKLLCPEWVDIRTPEDGYFPYNLAQSILNYAQPYKNFFIPDKEEYFCSLYYHAIVHKKENKYEEELRRAFLDWIPPVKPNDPHVGYYVAD